MRSGRGRNKPNPCDLMLALRKLIQEIASELGEHRRLQCVVLLQFGTNAGT